MSTTALTAQDPTDCPKEREMSSAATEYRFCLDPPGPGTWTIDAVHFPRPVTRY